MRVLLPLLALTACRAAAPVAVAAEPTPAAQPPDELDAITAAAADDQQAWDRLTHLCDDIGHRMTGSESLEQAVQWATHEMGNDGFDSVVAEPVEAEGWARGHERVHVMPDERALNVLTLGGSVGTPDGPVEAEVVVVDSLQALDALGDSVAGKIVLFNVPFTTYGETVPARTRGPGMAGAYGAVAALVRSITPASLNSPHTGGTWYGDNPPIPAVAVTLEDAEWMARRTADGHTVRVRVDLGAHDTGPVQTANVVATSRGTERANEVVVVGCHLDSWDVGQGAQDDGAGCILAWEAARDVMAAGPHKRTLRVVLYTNEEYGLAGGSQYPGAHEDDVHIAAIESDTGAGLADGFRVHVLQDDGESDDTEAVAGIIASMSAEGLMGRPGYAGADIGPLVRGGAIGFGVDHDTAGYWPIHHTRADTLEKIDRAALRENTRITARLLYWLLNDENLPRR